jgi:quaternary ammonium compound-resistance protein SugE
MAWLMLVVAGIFETCFAIALKRSEGFSRLWPTVLFLVFSLASFTLLSQSVKSLPIGTAYAVWTGIGAAGTATVGMLVLGEPASALRIASIALIICGVVGLNLSGASH